MFFDDNLPLFNKYATVPDEKKSETIYKKYF